MVSPDEKQIAFVEQGQFGIVDARNNQLICTHKLPTASGGLVGWSTDGKWIAFGGYGGNDGVGLWLMDVERKQVTQIDSGPFTQPVFSPDGTYLAVDLRANEKRREVWVMPTKKLRELPFTDVKKE